MAIVFMDSFDHYDDPSLKWSVTGTTIISLNGSRSRTGVGAMIPFVPTGAELNVTPQAGAVIGMAYSTEALQNADINGFISGTGVFRQRQVRTRMNSDGSISILSQNDPFPVNLGTSAPGLISTNTFVYIETKVSAFAAGATVTVRVNGQVVLTVTGNTDPDGTGTYNTFYVSGIGGGPTSAVDDLYLLNLLDSTIPGSPNNDFLGAVRIYAQPPIADATPLQWTPNAGLTNYTQVDEIPPDDGTTYVESSNVGDVDQYVYGTAGITPPVQVFGVQVNLDAAIWSGRCTTVTPSTAMPGSYPTSLP